MTDQEFNDRAQRYLDMVYRIALNWFGRAVDAEDAAQNAMLRFCRTDTAFESEEHIRRWLARVTVNECKRLAMSPWRRRTVPLESCPEPVFQERESRELYQAVMALPQKYRLPLYLYYYEDWPVGEIAGALGLKPSTVQTRLARAREKLRVILTEE